MKNWLVVIPARLASSRLPEKPLQDLCGRPLIVRVYENLNSLSAAGAQTVVATDSDRIVEICQKFQVPVMLSRDDHQSGTDRCYEIAAQLDREFVLNVQGDEPFIAVEDLRILTERLEASKELGAATLAYWNADRQAFEDPNVVKAVRARNDRALYFSRSPIPFHRGEPWSGFWQHIGVYAYRLSTLAEFCAMAVSPLERLECLEQLRLLEAGVRLAILPAQSPSLGIDTPEDLSRARELWAAKRFKS